MPIDAGNRHRPGARARRSHWPRRCIPCGEVSSDHDRNRCGDLRRQHTARPTSRLVIIVQIDLDCTVGHDVELRLVHDTGTGRSVSGSVTMGRRVYVGTGAVIINGTQQEPLTIGDDASRRRGGVRDSFDVAAGRDGGWRAGEGDARSDNPSIYLSPPDVGAGRAATAARRVRLELDRAARPARRRVRTGVR